MEIVEVAEDRRCFDVDGLPACDDAPQAILVGRKDQVTCPACSAILHAGMVEVA